MADILNPNKEELFAKELEFEKKTYDRDVSTILAGKNTS